MNWPNRMTLVVITHIKRATFFFSDAVYNYLLVYMQFVTDWPKLHFRV